MFTLGFLYHHLWLNSFLLRLWRLSLLYVALDGPLLGNLIPLLSTFTLLYRLSLSIQTLCMSLRVVVDHLLEVEIYDDRDAYGGQIEE